MHLKKKKKKINVYSSRLFLVVWCIVMFSLELHGMCLPTGGLWWTVFPSPTLVMSQPCWSCCATSVPLTPCWGAVSYFTVPVQVGVFLHYKTGWHRDGVKWAANIVVLKICNASFMHLTRFSLWPAFWSPSRVWQQLFCDLPATWRWLPGCLWALSSFQIWEKISCFKSLSFLIYLFFFFFFYLYAIIKCI